MLVVIAFILQNAVVPLGWVIVGAVIALAIVQPDKPKANRLDIGPALRRRAKRNHHLDARAR